ncbi:hypothetical protein HAP41_0000033365 [Bradyrhizobium barranii subsp. apii]|uniref:Uncharacterized protein n=1 Tax=Bradyrhizobium barranii subsp. apii TaxID=2819348 RepID=A0A8T5VFQ0_9BRAD|nr:hypothetical protein [Bradyrhizobium barranii]UPT85180.1 hypothetical protein HAP41_0000033365 [Bradyrhizobium barranii subsp. apii]
MDDVTSGVLSLLPRGRAWQTNEGAPMPGQEIGFSPDAFDGDAYSATRTTVSILYQYWRSYAVVLHYLTQRLCDLRMEFWCQSVKETRDEWMVEYGLPDDCDPFPDLCTKVAAIGGTRCEYYQAVAARSGWSIECNEEIGFCGSRAGGRAFAGRARAGRVVGAAALRIIVHLNESSAFQPRGRYLASRAGRMRAGRRVSCGPDLSPLKCILSRIVHAEIQLTFEASNGT